MTQNFGIEGVVRETAVDRAMRGSDILKKEIGRA